MAFMLFERRLADGDSFLVPSGAHYRLAGYNLIHAAWKQHGCPTDEGWHVDQEELLRVLTNGVNGCDTRRLVIDFHPTATRRIGLIELLDLYAYTFQAGAPGEASWTPLMLRLRDVFYQEYESPITPEDKARIISSLPEPTDHSDFVEFLYLTGPWNWGRNGSTNAAFIQGAARDYFRRFF